MMESLRNLCIEVFVQDFEKFYIAFSKCNDARLKRNFQFLRRVYSDEIASILFKKVCFERKLPKYYVDFLVNKYLKYLDTAWLKDCSWPTIAAKFAEIGSNLETVHFGVERKPWQYVICNLSHLQRVIYPHGCNDEFLEGIANFCPNVVEMDVTCSRNVTDAGLKYLCMKKRGKVSCPKLKKLYISRTRVTNKGVAHFIKNVRSLEVTDYRYLPKVLYLLHKNDLSTLSRLEPYNLKRLYLLHLEEKPFFTDLLKICLTLCPHLKSLSCPILQKDHFDLFSSLNELKHLRLQCPTDYEVNIINLIKLKGGKLKSLSIDMSALLISTILESCPSLTVLWLNARYRGDNNEASVEVNFQNNSNIASVPKKLETCFNTARSISSKLEEIVIEGCRSYSIEWKSDFLKCCERCPLKKICFFDSVIEIAFVKDILVNCRSLMDLSFDDCFDDCFRDLDLSKFAHLLPKYSKVHINDKSCLKSHYDYVEDFYDVVKDVKDYLNDDENDYHHNAYRSYFQINFPMSMN